jgi:hypothetical protein
MGPLCQRRSESRAPFDPHYLYIYTRVQAFRFRFGTGLQRFRLAELCCSLYNPQHLLVTLTREFGII